MPMRDAPVFLPGYAFSVTDDNRLICHHGSHRVATTPAEIARVAAWMRRNPRMLSAGHRSRAALNE